jgi:hypothetical protein
MIRYTQTLAMSFGAQPIMRKRKAKQKSLRVPTKTPRSPKRRQTAVDRYASLIGWVAFANGTGELPPEFAPMIADSARFKEEIRAFAKRWLDQIADLPNSSLVEAPARRLKVGPFVFEQSDEQNESDSTTLPPFFELMGPPRKWMVTPSQVIEVPGSNAAQLLAQALDRGGAARVRRCPICQKLFVKLNMRAKTCSRKCSNTESQRAWYRRHQAKERKRKAAQRWIH